MMMFVVSGARCDLPHAGAVSDVIYQWLPHAVMEHGKCGVSIEKSKTMIHKTNPDCDPTATSRCLIT